MIFIYVRAIIASVSLLTLKVGHFMFVKDYWGVVVAGSAVGMIKVFVVISSFNVIAIISFNSILLLSYGFISIIPLGLAFILLSFIFLFDSIFML